MRDNEPLVDIPSVAPDGDEIESYSRSRGGRSVAAAGLGGLAKFFLFLSLLLAAAALAGAAYLYQQLEISNTALDSASSRLGSLEERLSSTDESVNESATVQAVKIKDLTSEVDKLWASAWRKNQAEIGKYSKELSAQGSKIGKAETALAAQQQNLETLQKQLGEAQSLSTLIQEAQSASIVHATQLSELDDNIATLRASIDGSQKKIKESEEWIESFNSFRRQVNSKLSQLEDAMASDSSSPMQLSP